MSAYSYDPITKELLGIAIQQIDPITGGLLLPGCATYEEPPQAGNKEVAVWNELEKKWELLPDHRGEIYWHKKTKKEFIIDKIGTLLIDENYTNIEPPKKPGNFEFDNRTKTWLEVVDAEDRKVRGKSETDMLSKLLQLILDPKTRTLDDLRQKLTKTYLYSDYVNFIKTRAKE